MKNPQAGKIKSVLSGDTFILTSLKNPALERQISLPYVTAPHLKREGDEAHAFQSREFLRTNFVGKQCQFSSSYTAPSNNREYGEVIMSDGKKVLEMALEAGTVKLRDDAGARKDTSDEELQHIEKLKDIQAKAKSDRRGLWQGNDKAIENVSDPGQLKQMLVSWKGKDLPGIVEKVLSGDRLLMRLLVEDQKHLQSIIPRTHILELILTLSSHRSSGWDSITKHGSLQHFQWRHPAGRRIRP